ncbi:hypothetical protein LCGC14_1979970 [marine sediment metagenome]|uniref:Uncharacterized protein n=1 Tax=marine sediment metagenome TaxID=412755 RepID=A0A0F9FXF4_9ZZZZ
MSPKAHPNVLKTEQNTQEKLQDPPTPQKQMDMFAQAISNLAIRLNNAEIEMKKNSANAEVMNNRVDLLKSTIELLEKQVEFNDRKG